MKQYGAVDLRGLTGATATTRWVGGTTAGPPTTGTFAVGDWVVDQAGAHWTCTGAGTPGTWVLVGAGLVSTLANLPAASAANKGQFAYVSDLLKLTQSDGSAWVNVAAPTGLGFGAKGDIAVASGSLIVNKLSVSATAGSLIMPSTGSGVGLAWTENPYVGSVSPTAAKFETMPRDMATSGTLAASTSAVLRMVAIWLPINLVVTSITFFTGTTALTTGQHGWAALYDSSRALLRQSADDTTPGVEATANKDVTFTLTSTFTTTYAGTHYLGVLWAATGAMPTLRGAPGGAALNTLPPIRSGTSTTGLTATAPNPAAALTAVGDIPYAYVS